MENIIQSGDCIRLKYSKAFTPIKYTQNIITKLIKNKKCHLNVCLKEIIHDFIGENLRRIYPISQSIERIPKFCNYYKNYHQFFCVPTFRSQKYNNILNKYTEKKAELYYLSNYPNDKKKKQKPLPKEPIFTNTVKESLNNIQQLDNLDSSRLTVKLEKSTLVYKGSLIDEYKDKEKRKNKMNDSLRDILFLLNNKSCENVIKKTTPTTNHITLIAKNIDHQTEIKSKENIIGDSRNIIIKKNFKISNSNPIEPLHNAIKDIAQRSSFHQYSSSCINKVSSDFQRKTLNKLSIDILNINDKKITEYKNKQPQFNNNNNNNNIHIHKIISINCNKQSISNNIYPEIKSIMKSSPITNQHFNNSPFLVNGKTKYNETKLNFNNFIFLNSKGSSFNNFEKQQQLLKKGKNKKSLNIKKSHLSTNEVSNFKTSLGINYRFLQTSWSKGPKKKFKLYKNSGIVIGKI